MNLTRHLYERQVFDMSNSYTHLSLQDRIIIAAGISNGSSKAAIADTIGKDKSTVGKEIRLHRFLKYKCRLPRECATYKKCPSDRNCTTDCPDFVPFRCRRRDRTPGACNGCSRYSGCHFNKYWYNPQDAEKLNLILSNINSAPVQSCGGKTPFELLQFMFPDLYEKMIHYGLTPIEKDKVILKPYLLK